jgi:membrane-bound inhibitor of C-type lysozyme
MDMITAASLLAMAAAGAPGPSLQLALPLTGDAERKVVSYTCTGVESPVAVEYVNAPPNFLALMTVGGERLVLASVLAADGVRYVAGPFEWWTKGSEATFSDLRESPAAPVACTEASETP